jgi:thiamine biosynthesis lipoprotein
MKLSLFIFALLFLFSFRFTGSHWKTIKISGVAQGTTYQITYYSHDGIVQKNQTDSILKRLDSSFSLYKPNSLISRFNASAKGIRVDEHFIRVLKKSFSAYRDTKGLFDITVQPLVQAWGFGVSKTDSLPDKTLISSLKKCVGTDFIELKGNFLSKKKLCVKIDMNGIAQGYSVDVLANFLESKGINNYIVELGGEIRVKGRKQPSGEKMKIGIESPFADEFENFSLRKIILPESGAVTTSGSYRKYYESNGEKITHIINPQTGYPVQNELISVTAYAKDAITADAFDNALMVMGLDSAIQFIEKRKDLAAYFIYRKEDGSIADTASSLFYKLINY